ncbi:MAG TPA: hypothetical protein VGG57_17105 [Stellaceae bacterium]|jgi:hypothetical protein
MSTLNTCLKGLAAGALIAASPIFIVFIVPFGCGLASDMLDAAGAPAALAVMISICIAALAWTRYRWRPAMPDRRAVGALGKPIGT